MPSSPPRAADRHAAPASGRSGLPTRGPWIALISVLITGAIPFLICPRLEDAQARSRAGEALGGLRSCLGEPPNRATLRGRAIAAQLRGTDWPARCLNFAAELEVALTSLAGSSPPRCEGRCCDNDDLCAELHEARQILGRLRETLGTGRFDENAASRLFDVADRLGLERDGGEASTPPPDVVHPERPDDHPALTRGGYDASALVLADGDRWHLLLHARHKHALVCEVDPAEARTRCEPLPPQVPIAESVLLVDGAPRAPLHVLARRDDEIAPERWGVYAADGGDLVLELEHEVYGATVSPSGEVAALVHDGAGFFLMAPGASPLPLHLPGEEAGPPLLFGPWLFGAKRAQNGTEIIARTIAWRKGEPQLVEPTTVGAIEGWQPGRVAMQACRSAGLTVVVVTGEPPEEPATALVGLYDGQRWQSFRTSLSGAWPGMACDPEGVTLTQLEEQSARVVAGGGLDGRYLLAHQRCTTAGCRRAQSTVTLNRRRRASRYLAGSLGQQAALLWRSTLGDVRWVVASPDAIGQAKPRIAFEGDEHGGYGWDRHGAELLTRDGYALLLVASEKEGTVGTYGFVIGADGSFRRLRVGP